MGTRSAPASSSKFSTGGYSDSRKLGPTNLTIFNEIHERKRTNELRSELKKKQLDYSKRVNFQHKTTGLEGTLEEQESREMSNILGKLRKNIEVATLGKSNRTTTKDRFETSHHKAKLRENYAKSSIPKPRVFAKLMNTDNKTSSVAKITKPNTKSSKVLKINREYGDQNNGDQLIAKNTNTASSVTPKKAEDLDNLLDYMLERHKSEQHKLKSME